MTGKDKQKAQIDRAARIRKQVERLKSGSEPESEASPPEEEAATPETDNLREIIQRRTREIGSEGNPAI